MNNLFQFLHALQATWVSNLEYQLKEGWIWLSPLLTLMRDYFFECAVVLTVLILYIFMYIIISIFNRPSNKSKKVAYTDEFKTLVQGVDLNLDENLPDNKVAQNSNNNLNEGNKENAKIIALEKKLLNLRKNNLNKTVTQKKEAEELLKLRALEKKLLNLRKNHVNKIITQKDFAASIIKSLNTFEKNKLKK